MKKSTMYEILDDCEKTLVCDSGQLKTLEKIIRKRTQKEEVLDYLRIHKTIDRALAWSELGIAELPARICELEKEGYIFNKKRIPFTSRLGKKSSFIAYSLVGKSEGLAI